MLRPNPRNPFVPSYQGAGPNGSSTFEFPPLLNSYVNAVYYQNWRVYQNQPPSSLNLRCISHIIYAFAWVRPDGTVYLNDNADLHLQVENTKGGLSACAALRRQPSIMPKVLLSIGGIDGGKYFAEAVSTAEARHRFGHSAREIVLRHELDGIEICWEYPFTQQQGSDYLELVAILRTYLPLPQFQLTSALPAYPWALQHIDLSRVSSCLNYIFIMAYDFSGPHVDHCGHHAQLYAPPQPCSAASTISGHSSIAHYVANGVPSSKLVLGTPLYGRSFLKTNGPGHPFVGSGGEDGIYEYKDLPRPGAREDVDAQVCAAYCHGPDGEFVTYDNIETVRQKARYVRDNLLAGIAFWPGLGDAPGDASLVLNSFETLHGG